MAIKELVLFVQDFNKNGTPDAVVIDYRYDSSDEPDYSTIAVDYDEDGNTHMRLEPDINGDELAIALKS